MRSINLSQTSTLRLSELDRATNLESSSGVLGFGRLKSENQPCGAPVDRQISPITNIGVKRDRESP